MDKYNRRLFKGYLFLLFMTNDKIANDSYRKLIYFYENKIRIHFKDFDNIFYNGLIVDLNENKKIMVLSENVKGTMPILLEFINPDSIREYKEVEE